MDHHGFGWHACILHTDRVIRLAWDVLLSGRQMWPRTVYFSLITGCQACCTGLIKTTMNLTEKLHATHPSLWRLPPPCWRSGWPKKRPPPVHSVRFSPFSLISRTPRCRFPTQAGRRWPSSPDLVYWEPSWMMTASWLTLCFSRWLLKSLPLACVQVSICSGTTHFYCNHALFL